MSVSWYEQFVGVNWSRYSQVASKATCVCCLGVSILSFIFGFGILINLLTLLFGLILSIWEFPMIFACLPSFELIKTFLLESLHLKLEETKAALYFIMSLVCFSYPTLCIIPGIFLLLTAIILVFAAYNRITDTIEGSVHANNTSPYQPKETPSQNPHSSLLGGGNKFGTFA
mmetsp:Transcript_14387/g.19709  ORF Transcript_14387/g.19709 Transcript_14387/m.19709 type:complete len:172 (-) Transcript_14387:70-585(-)